MFCSCTKTFPQGMCTVYASLFEVASEYSLKVGLGESCVNYVSQSELECVFMHL